MPTPKELTDFRQAVEVAKIALAQAPTDPLLIRRLADATATLAWESGYVGEFHDEYLTLLDDAIELYKSAVNINCEDGVLLNNLGVAQSDRGFHAAAVETLRRASALIPDDRNARFNLAVALMNTNAGGREEALVHFETAAKLKSGAETREAYFDPQGH